MPPILRDAGAVVEHILTVRKRLPAGRSVLAALSGIDGAGKGYVSRQVVQACEAEGLRVAALNVDGWLNLPSVRFSAAGPAAHFYAHALRLDEMFSQLVLPLRDQRSIRTEADFAEETATAFRREVYEFTNVDAVVIEGIYLLKRPYQPLYDFSVWIDCTAGVTPPVSPRSPGRRACGRSLGYRS